MSNRRIEPCKTEHFYALNPREYDKKALFSMPNVDQLIHHYCSMSYAFTGFNGDDIIGMGGVFPLWPGVGEAWMFLGDDLKANKLFVFKQVKKYIELAFENLKIHRIQMVCSDEFNEAKNFAEHLGFALEGKMEQYTLEKKDYLLYARLKDG